MAHGLDFDRTYAKCASGGPAHRLLDIDQHPPQQAQRARSYRCVLFDVYEFLFVILRHLIIPVVFFRNWNRHGPGVKAVISGKGRTITGVGAPWRLEIFQRGDRGMHEAVRGDHVSGHVGRGDIGPGCRGAMPFQDRPVTGLAATGRCNGKRAELDLVSLSVTFAQSSVTTCSVQESEPLCR